MLPVSILDDIRWMILYLHFIYICCSIFEKAVKAFLKFV
jgi:hypothetical protein